MDEPRNTKKIVNKNSRFTTHFVDNFNCLTIANIDDVEKLAALSSGDFLSLNRETFLLLFERLLSIRQAFHSVSHALRNKIIN
jgi:hypothetical protein